MLLESLAYYWPRYLLGLGFAVLNSLILRRRGSGNKRFILNLVVLFALSPTVISLIYDQLATRFKDAFIGPGLLNYSESFATGVGVMYFIVVDALFVIIPIILFSKIIKERLSVAATVYLMYSLLDKLCLVMAVSAWSYFALMITIATLVILFTRKGMMYVVENSRFIEWRPVLYYQMGLFFLLDALYAAYYVFPGIVNGILDVKNLWIDAIAIVSFTFFIGFAELNIRATKEQIEKMIYMEELDQNERDIIQRFAEISEAKSGETGQHVRRVAEYSALIAKYCGLSRDEVEHIKIASMMHDVGKLLVPREIIEKPGELTPEEMEIMRTHTNYGHAILANSRGEVISMARLIACQHHERWDGKGYPNGLKGKEISLYAQIVSVADVYDALTSRRSYKEPWDNAAARQEILSQRGLQFSPKVVDIFKACFDEIVEIQRTYVD